MTRLALAPVVVVAALLGGCGGDGERDAGAAPTAAVTASPAAAATTTPTPTPTATGSDERDRSERRGRRIRAIDSQFGTILADRRGQALYLFDKEDRGRSECYGACARAWPPLLTSGRPVAGKGVRPRLLGTTKRRNGKRQVTYRGQPLYYYVDDAPGRILCHDVFEFGGDWLVVQPNGRPAD